MVGFDTSDDACVYRITDEIAAIHTVDFFTPIVDDPFWFGQIAAANALSDVYAMGGEPKLCLNIMAVPESMPKEAVHQLLRGGYNKVYEAGALITGGHSILDDEPKYGLAVTGFVHPDRVLTNSGAKPGDVLLFTKPLGIGVLSTAQKAEMLSTEGEALAYLIAPPLEAVVGLDEALKASDVELAALFEPPSETNFGGGLLTGTQSACNAACAAFAEAVKAVAARPREI